MFHFFYTDTYQCFCISLIEVVLRIKNLQSEHYTSLPVMFTIFSFALSQINLQQLTAAHTPSHYYIYEGRKYKLYAQIFSLPLYTDFFLLCTYPYASMTLHGFISPSEHCTVFKFGQPLRVQYVKKLEIPENI